MAQHSVPSNNNNSNDDASDDDDDDDVDSDGKRSRIGCFCGHCPNEFCISLSQPQCSSNRRRSSSSCHSGAGPARSLSALPLPLPSLRLRLFPTHEPQGKRCLRCCRCCCRLCRRCCCCCSRALSAQGGCAVPTKETAICEPVRARGTQ